eukprot:6398629-Amphidinium_carterae.1
MLTMYTLVQQLAPQQWACQPTKVRKEKQQPPSQDSSRASHQSVPLAASLPLLLGLASAPA